MLSVNDDEERLKTNCQLSKTEGFKQMHELWGKGTF